MAKKKRGGKGGRSVREIIERDAMRDVFALLHYSGQIAAGGPKLQVGAGSETQPHHAFSIASKL
jgi:hypothetical protein